MRFSKIMGEGRGIGGGHDLEAEQPNEHARAELAALTGEHAHNHFQSSLAALLAHRQLVFERPLLRELADSAVSDAALILAAGARGERQTDRARQGRPLEKFAGLAGLARNSNPYQLLDDPRLGQALTDALLSGLQSNVSTTKGLAKRMCEAWRETLTDLVIEAVFASEEPLWNALGKEDDPGWRQALPAATPPITTLVSHATYRKLIRSERPTVDFGACNGQGFSIRENFRERSRIHDRLWPIVFDGLANALSK
jgi:hypothetical protein